MDRKQIRALIGAAFMGAAGASLGATVGKGVGETLPELVLGLFVLVSAAVLSIETLILRSWEHLLILISGGIAGLILEYFIDSAIITYLVGAIVGLSARPILERFRSLLEEFTRRTPWFWPALFAVIVGSILLPILTWGQESGVLFEVFLAIAFFSLPLVAIYLVRRHR